MLSPQEQYPTGDPHPAPRRPRHHAVREIADDTGISRSAAAWHLQRLDADGLIESDRDGRAVRYALTDEALEIFVVLERGDHGRAC
ncbi:MAG: winged helix-turn-helix transcriptional regulator [Methanoculleus sp.]